MCVAFANAKATHIFSAKIIAYMPFKDQSFNDTLTNDLVSFEQLGPGIGSWDTAYKVLHNETRNLSHYQNKPIKIYWKSVHQNMKIFR